VTGTHRAGEAVTNSLGALSLAAGDHVFLSSKMRLLAHLQTVPEPRMQ
jgi:hypothetical protein